MSLSKSSGDAFSRAAANAGSIKCLVFEVLIVDLLLHLGLHAGKSSIMYNSLKTFK